MRSTRRCATSSPSAPIRRGSPSSTTSAGATPELGGSHYHLVRGLSGGTVPPVDTTLAPEIFRRQHDAIARGLVRSCHDLSEGGLAVAAAEMAFAGGVGADLTGLASTGMPD